MYEKLAQKNDEKQIKFSLPNKFIHEQKLFEKQEGIKAKFTFAPCLVAALDKDDAQPAGSIVPSPGLYKAP